ncbi:hypothetical protein MNBD_GAMMA23-1563 [hydrothermal vent metagenome]|uniref:GGDEF domain-containing protein n=1 Tax=hydrothermal vent metagenome TaxID=652676 RepID=A0A3B1AB54_9ZZZZ
MVFGKKTKDDGQPTQWKKKYYDSLDDLEHKEEQWHQVEKLLRNAIVRISLAASSENERLTKLLNSLREDIRNGKDSLNLRVQLDKITAIIRDIDTADEQVDNGYSAEKLVEECVERVQWTDKAQQFKRGLARQFNNIKDDEIQKFIHAFTKLINQEFIWYNEELDLIKSEKNHNIQGKKENHSSADNETDKVRSEDPVPYGTTTHPQNTEIEKEAPLEYSAVLLSFLKNLPANFIDESKLRQLQLKAASSQTRQQAIEMMALIADSLSTPPSVPENKVPPEMGIFSSQAVDLLIEFLELISLPEDLSVTAEKIRQTLMSEPAKLKECLGQTVELVMALQMDLKNERKELEAFLSELGSRLQEIDEEVKKLSGISDKRSDNFRAMNDSVNKTTDDINHFLNDETNIDTLKDNVKSHVIMIRHHMDTFLSTENTQQNYSDEVVQQLAKELIAVKREAEALREQLEKKRLQATHDTLTRIPNRLAYDEWISQEHDRFTKYNTPFVLMVWDVDFFKRVNDEFGHQAGDKVLRIIAQMLSENIRDADFVARYGGEEFVVVLPGTLLTAAMKIAENIRKGIEACAFHFRDKPVKVTASAGICEIRDNESVQMLFERADKALYKAKDNGRNICITG